MLSTRRPPEAVNGANGSRKTTFAAKLARRLDVADVDWTPLPRPELQ
jgi:hypothetical protein